MKRLIVILLLAFISFAGRYYDPTETATLALAPGSGTNKYVDGTLGSDSYDGNSPVYTSGTNGPYKTIGKATTGRAYGDRVMILAGTYRPSNTSVAGINPGSISGTGSEDNRLIIGPYGDGEVIIDRSLVVTWSLYGGNIYQATIPSTYTAEWVIMDDNFKSCRLVTSLEAADSDGEFYQSGQTLYLYVATGTPDSRGAAVGRYDPDNTKYGIFISGKSYVTVYGITIKNAPSYGASFYQSNYITLDHCKILYSGKAALYPATSHTAVTKCWFKDNIMMNWPRGRHWGNTGGWPANNIGKNHGSISGTIVENNGGEGISVVGNYPEGGTVIQDNIVVNSYSMGIYVDSAEYVTIRRNIVIAQDPSADDVVSEDLMPDGSSTNGILRKMRSAGITIGDENNAGGGSEHIDVYDNLIAGCRYGVEKYTEPVVDGWRYDNVYNNTIIMPNYDPTEISDQFYGLYVRSRATDVDTNIKNNLIIGTDAKGILIYKNNEYSGLSIDYNIYYHPNNATPFRYLTTNYNFADWKTQTGFDANSVNDNPTLVGADWDTYIGNFDSFSFDSGDFSLDVGSPAIDAGVTLGSPYDYDFDFSERPQGELYDLGAFEVPSTYPGDTCLTNCTLCLTEGNCTVSPQGCYWWTDGSCNSSQEQIYIFSNFGNNGYLHTFGNLGYITRVQ